MTDTDPVSGGQLKYSSTGKLDNFSEKLRKTIDYYRSGITRSVRSVAWRLTRRHAQRPIFVVGCSRAGTTLVYKTLSQSEEIGSLQRETHDFWVALHPLQDKHWETHGLGRVDASEDDRRFVARYFYAWTGQDRWVDKNNQNGLCVDYLHTLFPDAIFVYVKRSPGDNINSLIEGWGKPEEFATWSQHLPDAVRIPGGFGRWCFFLAEGWREYLQRPLEDVCAFQYRAMNSAILTAKASIPGNQWIEVFYEDFLGDPVNSFRKIFVHAGLSFTDELARHCRQVLAVPYNAFSDIRLDKWKDSRNRDRIERALPQVADVARDMGYAVD